MKTLPAIALSLLLAASLASCTPTSTDDTSNDDDSSSEIEESEDDATDDGGFDGAVLAGTGDYAVPDDAPIGGYELPDNQDGLPDGCTWTLYIANGDVLAESNGQFVFLTDVTTRFVTDGCPDWHQFE